MFGSEYFFLVFDYIPGFRFLLCIFAFLVKYIGQVAPRPKRIRMLRSKHSFVHLDKSTKTPLGSSSLGDLTISREGSAD